MISLGGQADTDAAVAAARAAFDDWAFTPKRGKIASCWTKLGRDLQRPRQDEMAHAISLEMGAPIEPKPRASQWWRSGPWHHDAFVEAFKRVRI